MTQEDLAETLGYSVEFVSLVERGINAPPIAKLETIAKVLRVPVRDLFTFEEKGGKR